MAKRRQPLVIRSQSVPNARVTIVTPTFNHLRYISACIDSVIAQTVTDWEMIIVDDGSKDGTADLLRTVRDPRIRVIYGEHRGLGRLHETYAAALSASAAPLVAILEGDDTWPAEKLERQLPDFDDPDVVLSYGVAALLDEDGCRYAQAGPSRRTDQLDNRPPGAITGALAASNFVIAPTVILRRSALEEIGGFQQPLGVPFVDHLTWLMLAERGTFRYHTDLVGCWRRHPAQYTTSSVDLGPPEMSYVNGHLVRTELTSDRSIDVGRRSDERAALNRFRRALLAGSSREVVSHAFRLIKSGRARLTAAALFGFASWLLGGDLEWLARRQRLVSWPSRRHARRHQKSSRASATR